MIYRASNFQAAEIVFVLLHIPAGSSMFSNMGIALRKRSDKEFLPIRCRWLGIAVIEYLNSYNVRCYKSQDILRIFEISASDPGVKISASQ